MPKYWNFSFSINLSKYSGFISFRIDWFDLLEVQGTLKSLFQPHKSKSSSSSVHSVLYGPTLTPIHDYWKNHSFDYMDLVGKVMSLLFNILSRFVIAALPKTKHLLISWLYSQSTVISEPKKPSIWVICRVCKFLFGNPKERGKGPLTQTLSIFSLTFHPVKSAPLTTPVLANCTA